MMDRVDQLERLAKLKAEGLLTDDEFAAEKARILASEGDGRPRELETRDSPGRQNGPGATPTSQDVDALASSASSGDPHWRFGRVQSAKEAFQLIWGIWAGAVSLFAADFVQAVVNVRDLLAGEEVIPGIGQAETFALTVGVQALTGIVLFALAAWTVRRRSLIASSILLILGLGALAMTLGEKFSEGGWPLIGQGLMTALGLFLVGQAIRGVLASRRYDAATNAAAEAEARAEHRAARPKTMSTTLKQGFDQTRDVRRIMRTAALLALLVGVLLIGFLVWRWSREDNSIGAMAERMNESAAGPLAGPSSGQSGAAQATAQVQAVAPTDAYLAGWWVEQGDQCAGSMAFELTADHRYLNLQAEGSWGLTGSTLRFDTVGIDAETGQPISQREVEEGQIWIVDQNEFSGSFNSGVRRFRRCHDGSEYEPWGPF